MASEREQARERASARAAYRHVVEREEAERLEDLLAKLAYQVQRDALHTNRAAVSKGDSGEEGRRGREGELPPAAPHSNGWG
eukprot:3420305-Pleurochrysis_carterae.AAC.1